MGDRGERREEGGGRGRRQFYLYNLRTYGRRNVQMWCFVLLFPCVCFFIITHVKFTDDHYHIVVVMLEMRCSAIILHRSYCIHNVFNFNLFNLI